MAPMAVNRIPPTPEDTAIFLRQIKRVELWSRLVRPTDSMHALKAMRAATGDYLHFSASEKISK